MAFWSVGVWNPSKVGYPTLEAWVAACNTLHGTAPTLTRDGDIWRLPNGNPAVVESAEDPKRRNVKP